MIFWEDCQTLGDGYDDNVPCPRDDRNTTRYRPLQLSCITTYFTIFAATLPIC